MDRTFELFTSRFKCFEHFIFSYHFRDFVLKHRKRCKKKKKKNTKFSFMVGIYIYCAIGDSSFDIVSTQLKTQKKKNYYSYT